MTLPFKCFLAGFAGIFIAVALFLGYAFSQAHDKPAPPVASPPPAVTPANAGAHEQPRSSPPHTFWLTPDNDGGKASHIGYSAVIGMGLRFHDRQAPWWDRTAWCMVPGVAKELLDYHSGSGVSRIDLRNDLLGCLGGVTVGSGLLYLTRNAQGTTLLTARVPLH